MVYGRGVFSFALRRMLWAIPTLVGISLVVFLLTSLLPDPALSAAALGASDDTPPTAASLLQIEEARRLRFVDLPKFINENPEDVRSRTQATLDAIAAGGPEGDVAELRLAQIGGAALPTALPRLNSMTTEARRRVARALTPLATRMAVDPFALGTTPDDALKFWERFWQDHVMDFTPGASKRAVERLVRHGTELRAEELASLDTYALADLMDAIEATDRHDALLQLMKIVAKITQLVPPDDAASPQELEALRAQYTFFWYVHRSDYVPLEGLDRVLASVTETRYAKWTIGAFTGSLEMLDPPVKAGDSSAATRPHRRGEGDLRHRLARRATVTLALIFLSLFGSHLVAIPLGVFAAARSGRRADRVLSVVLFFVYSLPTFVIAAVFRGLSGGSVVAPVIALSLGAAATLSRYQRTALLEVLTTDYVRTARAKGASGLRVLLTHALRNAVLPIIALAGVQVPQLLGGAFVVEEVWQIRGLGWETLRAIERRDVGWLVVVVCLTAVLATCALVGADLLQAALDPRARETFRRRGEA